jgi:hypothetical protein
MYINTQEDYSAYDGSKNVEIKTVNGDTTFIISEANNYNVHWSQPAFYVGSTMEMYFIGRFSAAFDFGYGVIDGFGSSGAGMELGVFDEDDFVGCYFGYAYHTQKTKYDKEYYQRNYTFVIWESFTEEYMRNISEVVWATSHTVCASINLKKGLFGLNPYLHASFARYNTNASLPLKADFGVLQPGVYYRFNDVKSVTAGVNIARPIGFVSASGTTVPELFLQYKWQILKSKE